VAPLLAPGAREGAQGPTSPRPRTGSAPTSRPRGTGVAPAGTNWPLAPGTGRG